MVEPAELPFEAGQWISVPFGPKTVRAWSMLSTPAHKGMLTLAVDVAPGGIVFNRADPRRAVFFAEEIGIVPVRSILADLYETGFGRPAILIFWARDPSWLLYDAEFRSLARRYPGFTYVPAVREAPGGWRGETGEPAQVIDRLVHSVDRLVVYACGGGDTINAVRDALVKKGMDRKSVKWEKFW